MNDWEGVLPLWKEAGLTSHDCVARARRLLKQRRIGHTGTLDPDVSGVLPLCLGRATRIVEYLQELPKTYEAALRIGYATDTEDAGGSVTERADKVTLSEDEIRNAVLSFVGTIEQIPPMYSAVKVEGKRLYELAREGHTVERKPRTVTVYDIDVQEVRLEAPYPSVSFRVTCSKGTYIRTLCADIGRSLGYPAVMASLVRTGSGSIRKEQCITLAEAERLLSTDSLESRLVPIDAALAHMPAGEVSDNAVRYALQGRTLFDSAVRMEGVLPLERAGLVRLFGRRPETGTRTFIGIYKREDEQGTYIPEKLFI
ncbi:tRNA pseudouridine(55) synthase TruB [Paenibacillus alkalitolerans]|uniref:tRNA pseudouridine(55) synthase TruB n=1 Tax=Paenibacillus alkalitolerans TaxID=2799335 RepID=UPI0018F6463F|nr:tRNA pseudouridine(55) synthase TruB [Paenibacillus alkalitolerans]